MQLRYKIASDEHGFRAECPEFGLSAVGATERDALKALGAAAVERLTRVEALAPPSQPPRVMIDLVPERGPHPDADRPR